MAINESTNEGPDLLDAALMRPGRLDRHVLIPPPDQAARADILRIALRRTPHDLSDYRPPPTIKNKQTTETATTMTNVTLFPTSASLPPPPVLPTTPFDPKSLPAPQAAVVATSAPLSTFSSSKGDNDEATKGATNPATAAAAATATATATVGAAMGAAASPTPKPASAVQSPNQGDADIDVTTTDGSISRRRRRSSNDDNGTATGGDSYRITDGKVDPVAEGAQLQRLIEKHIRLRKGAGQRKDGAAEGKRNGSAHINEDNDAPLASQPLSSSLSSVSSSSSSSASAGRLVDPLHELARRTAGLSGAEVVALVRNAALQSIDELHRRNRRPRRPRPGEQVRRPSF